MSFLERIAQAFRPAAPIVVEPEPTVREERSSPPGSDLLARAVDAGGLGSALSSGIYRNDASPRKGASELVELYRNSPWLRSVSHKVATGVASVPWKLYTRRAPVNAEKPDEVRGYVEDFALARMAPAERHAAIREAVASGDMDELPVHPLLRVLDRPNPAMSGFAARVVTTIHLDLLGESFWVMDTDAAGLPVRFWPIPSHWVKSIATPAAPFFRVSFPEFDGIIPANRMIWFRDVDPGDPYARGSGLGMSLADELDIDESAAKTIKAFFENTAIPPLLVSLKGASQPVVDRARLRWEKMLKGFRRAYQTFFTGAEISVERLDTTFKDMELNNLRKGQRDIVGQTWGVPPEKLGIIENSNRANIDGAELIWTKDVLVPRLELQRMELQNRVVVRYDQRLILDYVSPVPEDLQRRQGVVVAMPAYFKINEVRELAALPPLPNGEGEGFLVDPTKVYVRELCHMKPLASPAALAAGLLLNNEARAQMNLGVTSAPWGSERTSSGAAPAPSFGPPPGPPALPSSLESPKPLPPPVPPGEPGDEGGPPAPPAPPAPPPPKPPEARAGPGRRASVLSVRNLRRVLESIDVRSIGQFLTPEIEALVEAFGSETLDVIESTKRFDMNDPKVGLHIAEMSQDRIGRLINGTTRENLREMLTSWDGDDDEVLLSGVRDVFDTARVERSQAIAETEGTRSKEFATHQAMVQSGIVLSKEWVAVGDGRTREEHLAMDGQVVGIDEPFVVPAGSKWTGAKAQTPCSFGIPALDCRCRCLSAPVFDLEPDAPDEQRAALLRAGVLPKAATAKERSDLWEAQDKKLRRWEGRLSDAAVQGFDVQEARVLDVLREVLG